MNGEQLHFDLQILPAEVHTMSALPRTQGGLSWWAWSCSCGRGRDDIASDEDLAIALGRKHITDLERKGH